jgi:yecA family protein
MTRYEAHIEKDWREHGLAHLLVARIRGDGSADVGVFLVDVFCLGVKDAFLETDVPASELEEFIATNLPDASRERIHPACAKKLIDGAMAYAESLGFAPHRDFRKARRVLSGLDTALCPTEFTFGANGRPCFVQGPNDTPERIERVLAILEARCGPDGFDYELADDDEDADDDEFFAVRDDLIAFLDGEPPEVPRFYFLSGVVTALQLCPAPLSPLKAMEALWGPPGRVWDNQADVQEFASLLMEYWNYVGDLVGDTVAPGAPEGTHPMDVWAEDFGDDYDLPLTAASIEWSVGFMRAIELWPDAWGNTLTRPDLAPHWETVRLWSRFFEPGTKELIAAAAEGPERRTLAPAVAALARGLRPPELSPEA